MAKRMDDDTDSFTSVLRGPDPHGRPSPPAPPLLPADPYDDPRITGERGSGRPAPHPPSGYTIPVEPLVRDPEPETILLRVRPHARRLMIPVLILLATVTAFGYYGGRFLEEWQNWTATGVASGLVFFGTLLPFIAWLGHRYTITSRRIIARTGLVVRHRHDVYFTRVSEVRLRRTPLQAAFATGNVIVSAGPESTLVLHDVPSARLVSALLGELTS